MDLIDKISSITTLTEGWLRVCEKKNYSGYDGISGKQYATNLNENLEKLSFKLKNGLFNPFCPKDIILSKRVSLLTIEDRIVSYAVSSELEWAININLPRFSFAYQKDKSAFSAIDYAKNIIFNQNLSYFVKLDIKHFFDDVCHSTLMSMIQNQINCQKTIELIDKLISPWIVKDGALAKKEQGLIWGSPLSPLLSNIYMINFDYALGNHFPLYVRYSDDILLGSKGVFDSEDTEFIEKQLTTLNLEINKKKYKQGHFSEGVNFLGSEIKKQPDDLEKRIAKLYVLSSISDLKWEDYVHSELDLILMIILYGHHHALDHIETNIAEDLFCIEKVKEIAVGPGSLLEKLGFVSDLLVFQSKYHMSESINRFSEKVSNQAHEISMTKEHAEIYFNLFLKGHKSFYSGRYQDGQRVYVKSETAPDQNTIAEAVQYRESIAIRPMNALGQSKIFILDIDIEKKVLLEFENHERMIQGLLKQAFLYALNVQELLKKEDIASYVVFSGQKGYHLWIFMDDYVTVDVVWGSVKAILSLVYLPKALNLERIPKMSFEESELIKLPYSFHEVTKLQSTFVSKDGLPVMSCEFLKSIRLNSLELFKNMNLGMQSIQSETLDLGLVNPSSIKDFPEHIKNIYMKCKIMRRIVDKAFSHQYLNHFERNALLYIFAHCGNTGRQFVHFIIERCINYNPSITESYLQNIKAFPVSCQKLQLRFSDSFGNCQCDFSRYPLFYPSPVIYAYEVNPLVVTKPDYVQHDFQVQQTIAMIEESKVNTLTEKLLELLNQKKQLEKDILNCSKQLEDIFKKNQIKEHETDFGTLTNVNGEWMVKIKL